MSEISVMVSAKPWEFASWDAWGVHLAQLCKIKAMVVKCCGVVEVGVMRGGSDGLKTTGVCVIRKELGHVAFRAACCCARGWFGEASQLSAMGSWMWRSSVAIV